MLKKENSYSSARVFIFSSLKIKCVYMYDLKCIEPGAMSAVVGRCVTVTAPRRAM